MGNCQQKSKYGTKEESETTSLTPSWHKGSILGLSQYRSESGLPFASCSEDKQIALINDPSQAIKSSSRNIVYCNGHLKAVNKVSVSKRFVWSVSRDLSLRQWDHKGSAIAVYEGIQTLNITGVVVSEDETKVFTGSRDYTVKAFNTETKKCIHEYTSPRNIVTFLESDISSPDRIYQGSEDLCVRVWDSRASEGGKSTIPSQHLTGGYVYFPLCGNLDSTGNYLATGCKGFNGVGCEVKVWDLRMSRVVHEFSGVHEHDVNGCQFLPDTNNRYIASVSKDGKVCIWDTEINKLAAKISTDKNYTSLCVAHASHKSSLKSSSLIVGAFDGSLSELRWQNETSDISIQGSTNAAFLDGDIKGYSSPETRDVESS